MQLLTPEPPRPVKKQTREKGLLGSSCLLTTKAMGRKRRYVPARELEGNIFGGREFILPIGEFAFLIDKFEVTL